MCDGWSHPQPVPDELWLGDQHVFPDQHQILWGFIDFISRTSYSAGLKSVSGMEAVAGTGGGTLAFGRLAEDGQKAKKMGLKCSILLLFRNPVTQSRLNGKAKSQGSDRWKIGSGNVLALVPNIQINFWPWLGALLICLGVGTNL